MLLKGICKKFLPALWKLAVRSDAEWFIVSFFFFFQCLSYLELFSVGHKCASPLPSLLYVFTRVLPKSSFSCYWCGQRTRKRKTGKRKRGHLQPTELSPAADLLFRCSSRDKQQHKGTGIGTLRILDKGLHAPNDTGVKKFEDSQAIQRF